MPYRDPDKKREHSREYSKKKVKEGYGKALYARRKHHYQNEEILRDAVQSALGFLNDGNLAAAVKAMRAGLRKAPPVGKPLDYMPEEKE